jgi:hypothetical protein
MAVGPRPGCSIHVSQLCYISMGPNTVCCACTGGHEVMIHETWLGEYLYSDPRSHMSNLTATGIWIAGILEHLMVR